MTWPRMFYSRTWCGADCCCCDLYWIIFFHVNSEALVHELRGSPKGCNAMVFMWRFPKIGVRGTPKSSILINRVFHCKSSISGSTIYGNPHVIPELPRIVHPQWETSHASTTHPFRILGPWMAWSKTMICWSLSIRKCGLEDDNFVKMQFSWGNYSSNELNNDIGWTIEKRT